MLEITSYGDTPFHKACDESRRIDTVKMLLENWNEFAIDIKAQNHEGKTALDLLNDRLGRITRNVRLIDKLREVKKCLKKNIPRSTTLN